MGVCVVKKTVFLLQGEKKLNELLKNWFYFPLFCFNVTFFWKFHQKPNKYNILWNIFSMWLSLYIPLLIAGIIILFFIYKSPILIVDFYFWHISLLSKFNPVANNDQFNMYLWQYVQLKIYSASLASVGYASLYVCLQLYCVLNIDI